MKKTYILFVVAVGVSAFALGYEIQKHTKYEELLWYSYEKSSNAIKHHTHILENLRSGNDNKAISHLERLIDLDASVVSGCANDLCKGKEVSDFEESLNLYEKYKATHPNDNGQ